MSRYIADQNKAVFQYESGTYASASGGTAAQWIGIVTDHTLSESTNVEHIRYLGGATRDVSIHVDGPLDADGTITFHPQDWKFLAFALGSNVDAGSPSPYTHTISATNSNVGNYATSGTLNPFLSFTIEDSQTAPTAGNNFVRTVNGCVVDTLTMKAGQGDIIEVSVDYKGQSIAYSSGTALTSTASTSRPFLWQDVKVHIPSGTVINEVSDFSFSIKNNLDAPHYLNGSRVISVPIPTDREYEMDLTLHGTSERTKTLYDAYYKGGSTFNVLLEITDTSAGAGSRDLLMSLSGCKLDQMDAPSPNQGANEQSLTIVPSTVTVIIDDTTQLYNAW